MLENQSQAHTGTERLLKEIVVHAGGREGQFEVLVVDAKTLVGVLVDECLGLSVSNVEGIETKLEIDTLSNFPRILEVRINSSGCGCTVEVAATEQRHFSRILIGLLGNQCS